MLLVEENHAGASTSTHTDNRMLYTRREIGPVDVEGEASRCAMEAANEIKEGGTEVMPTTTLDPLEIGGVGAMRTGKENPSRSAGTVARKATRRASAGRSAPIRREQFRTCRQGKSAALALRRRLRENRKRVSLGDETRSEPDEADQPEIGRGVVRRLRRVKPYDEP